MQIRKNDMLSMRNSLGVNPQEQSLEEFDDKNSRGSQMMPPTSGFRGSLGRVTFDPN